MDTDELKNLIEIDGGKFIIVENGKPLMVVIGFDEYKQKLIGKKEPSFAKAAEGRQKPVSPKELESDGLRLEDLPL